MNIYFVTFFPPSLPFCNACYFLSRKSSYASNWTGGVEPLLVTLRLGKGWDGIKREEKRMRWPRAQPFEIFNRSGIHYFRESRLLLSISLRPLSRIRYPTTELMPECSRLEEEHKWKKKRETSKKRNGRKKERGREKENKRQRQNRNHLESLNNYEKYISAF